MSVEAKLSKLLLNLQTASPAGSNQHTTLKTETPDSWDDAADEDEPVEAPGPTLKQVTSNDSPAPPPPTPISPESVEQTARKWDGRTERPSQPSRYPQSERERRPEKTTATANRLIAGALGMKAPKKTEEQKQYDRAVKEAEVKRRNKEKELLAQQKKDDEQAKAAVWDD